jgi:hypothetical protein
MPRGLYCPSISCRTDLLDGHNVPQEARQVFEIPIKLENLLDWAIDSYTGFDYIFVPQD